MTEDSDWLDRQQLHFAVADGDNERVKAIAAAGFRLAAVWSAHEGHSRLNASHVRRLDAIS